MNAQRDVIYKRRRNALYGDKLSIDIANMIYEISSSIIEEYHGNKDYEGFNIECIKNFGIEGPFAQQQFSSGKKRN